jgi:phage terminase large subunit
MSKALEIQHTSVFSRNLEAVQNNDIRFVVNQGGSRSSKTYSIMQLLIVYCLTNAKTVVSIVRKSFPSLRASVLRDFVEIMRDLNLYQLAEHHKTENIYNFSNGSQIEFFAIDDEQKLRGRKRHILWANEANEISFDEFNQLNMRTTDKLIFDFNPSDEFHWLYDLLLRQESQLIKSTYRDNPFLQDDIVKEIENLIAVDENYYKIYALGEKPVPTTRIYTHFSTYDRELDSTDDFVYGLDFGYNHPSALIKVTQTNTGYYCQEVIYQQFLTSSDLLQLFASNYVDKNKYIYADYSRPEIIQDLRRSGYNVKEAIKDVKPGIMSVKSNAIFVHKDSQNILKEYRMYSWKTKGEQILDEPVKLYDDALDAIRYAIHSHQKKKFNAVASTIFVPKLKRDIDDDDW